jgi:hypothetical protein
MSDAKYDLDEFIECVAAARQATDAHPDYDVGYSTLTVNLIEAEGMIRDLRVLAAWIEEADGDGHVLNEAYQAMNRAGYENAVRRVDEQA